MRLSLKLLLVPLLSLFMFSCGSDDDAPEENNFLTGEWIGKHFYYTSSTFKYQYLYVTLNPNHTGELEYESDAGSYAFASFKWSKSGDYININGVFASANGDGINADENFTLTLEIKSNNLLKVTSGRFNPFVLTKDGSVETNGDGQMVSDKSEMLHKIWVDNNDGLRVVQIYPNREFEEWILDNPKSNKYILHEESDYYYDYRKNLLRFGYTDYTISILTDDLLTIYRPGTIINFRSGTNSDIPTQSTY